MCAARLKEVEQTQTSSDVQCPIRYMLDRFGGKWKQPIICMLSSGTPLRYSALKRRLGNITDVMLAQSLKELEANGIIHREQYNEVPPRVEYTLTKKGQSVVPIIAQAAAWAVEDMQTESVCGAYCEKCLLTP